MSTHYTISVENRRGANTNYAVFMEPPQFSDGGDSFMNVWYSSFVPFGGSFEIMTGLDFYACSGTTYTKPAPGVIVNQGMSLPANLGTSTVPGSTFELKILSEFPVLEQINPSSTTPGSFEVRTGDDFSVPNDRFLIGLAKVNNRGQIVPVASMTPLNNQKIQITPKMKFFVSESMQVAGEIVDYDAVAKDGATIDFSAGEGLGKYFAHVVQDDDGRFRVTYYDHFDD